MLFRIFLVQYALGIHCARWVLCPEYQPQQALSHVLQENLWYPLPILGIHIAILVYEIFSYPIRCLLEYAQRVGIWRILNLLKEQDAGIPPLY